MQAETSRVYHKLAARDDAAQPSRTECAEATRASLEKLLKETPFLFNGFDIAEMRKRADGYVAFAKYLDKGIPKGGR